MKLFVWAGNHWVQMKNAGVKEVLSTRERFKSQGYCTCLVKG